MDLATAKAEGGEPDSPIASYHRTLPVANLGGHVEHRRECVEASHHHLVMAMLLLLFRGMAMSTVFLALACNYCWWTTVGADARATAKQEREWR